MFTIQIIFYWNIKYYLCQASLMQQINRLVRLWQAHDRNKFEQFFLTQQKQIKTNEIFNISILKISFDDIPVLSNAGFRIVTFPWNYFCFYTILSLIYALRLLYLPPLMHSTCSVFFMHFIPLLLCGSTHICTCIPVEIGCIDHLFPLPCVYIPWAHTHNIWENHSTMTSRHDDDLWP